MSVTERQKVKHSSCPGEALYSLKGEADKYKMMQAKTKPAVGGHPPPGGERRLAAARWDMSSSSFFSGDFLENSAC